MRQLRWHKQFWALLTWLGICFVAAGIGSVASIKAGSFYAQLARPEWAPPAFVFGPVWATLYVLMAVSAWLVWRIDGGRATRMALGLFFFQLAVNVLWSWLFFRWQLGALAFADVIFLWVLIVAMISTFWHLRPLAGALQVPYLCWVSFAAALNYSVWQLNPQLLG